MDRKIVIVQAQEVLSNSGLQNAIQIIQNNGAIIVKNIVPADTTINLKKALINCLEEDKVQHGPNYTFFGMVHALMKRDKIFRDLIENAALLRVIRGILGHGAIIHAYNSSSMPPGKSNFSRNIHVDCPRLIPNYITNLGMTLALDSFTSENGAMEIFQESFTIAQPPSESEFSANAIVLNNVEAGDALFFNARCWHRGGINKTDNWRHSVTMNCCRAYMRQQFYFPDMFSEIDSESFSDNLKQMLGYFVRMPKNMEDFLLPAESRLYRSGQE